jgi:peptide/nickel transport system ATP-binding protein
VEVRDLHVGYRRHRTVRPAVRGVDLRIEPGETVAVVGGSGSGKTTTAQAVLGLLPPAGVITSGQVIIEGDDVTHARDRVLRRLRGSVVGLVPQDPTVGLNPTQRIGAQVAEAVRHRGVPERSSRRCPTPACPTPPYARGSIRTSSPAGCASGS